MSNLHTLAGLVCLLSFVACGRSCPVTPAVEDVSVQGLAKPIPMATTDYRARVEVTVLRNGVPVEGVEVAFSQSISGRPARFDWRGITDADGWAEIEISVDARQFWRVGVSGYYVARAVHPASGEIVEEWRSIPVSGGGRHYFLLPIGETAQMRTVSLKDRGQYVLESDPDSLVSYGGGGGIFILSMIPDGNFEGQVALSLVAEPALNARLSTESLTRYRTIAEVDIRPDTLIAPAIYWIEVIAMHASATDTYKLGVSTLVDGAYWFELINVSGGMVSSRDDFILLLQSERPELGIATGLTWFAYAEKLGGWDGSLWAGSSTWVSVNPKWEMRVRRIVIPRSPTWFLLRRRGEKEAIFAAKKEAEGQMYEIPVREYFFSW